MRHPLFLLSNRPGFWLLYLLLAGLSLGRATAQVTAPAGGTLGPAASTVCAGFNAGTLTLTGYAGTVQKFQQDQGTGYVDIPNSAGASYTFSNLTLTTKFRAIVLPGTGAAVASTEATVTVNQPPTATINSSGPTTFCTRGTIYLLAGPGGPGYTYQFLMNGRDIAGATSQTYTANVTAAANYSVRVTDAAGCSAISSSVQVRVNTNDVVSLTAAGPTTFCQGGSVALNGAITNGNASNYTYQFTLNGANIPGATGLSYTATASGSYAVVVYNPNTCSATSLPVVVTVNPPTVPTLSYASSTYCQGGAAPTPAATPAGGTYTASPTGLSLNASTGTINPAGSAPGTYTVTYTAGTPCPGSTTKTVTIVAPPTAAFGYVTSTGCAGATGTLTPAIVPGSTGGTYTASPTGLSLSASTGTIDLSQSQPGTYTVTNTVAAANGCAAVVGTATVTLTAQPVATLAAGGPVAFCTGGAVGLTAGGGSAGSSYQFLLNGQAIPNATGPSYSATASGAYSVRIANGSCASTSAAVSVTVNATPAQPVLTLSGGTLSTPVVAGATYQFYLNSLLVPGTTGNSIAASQNGSYTVVITSAAGCASAASAPVAVVVTATTTAQSSLAFSIFPNPTPDGQLSIGWAATRQATQLTVLNGLGQVLRTAVVPANASTTALDLRGLASGVYLLQVVTAEGTATRRFVRE